MPIRDNEHNCYRSDVLKAEAFSIYLEDTFLPFPDKVDLLIKYNVEAPYQMKRPISFVTPLEIRRQISLLKSKEYYDFDRIGHKVSSQNKRPSSGAAVQFGFETFTFRYNGNVLK